MVNVKALIFVPATLMTTAVMAQSSASGSQVAELEASASVALANMASVANIPMDVILQKLEKAEDYKETAFDGIGDFVTSVLYPLGFGELCGLLTDASNNLGYILDLNTKNGVHCSEETRNIISNATSCKSPDELSGLVSAILWPLAIRGFKDTALKIDAQTSCLKKLLTGQ